MVKELPIADSFLNSTNIFGALVLHTKSEPEFIDLGLPSVRGTHIDATRGVWFDASSIETRSIYLPQRYKTLSISCLGDIDNLCEGLETSDSQWESARQLYKLNQIQQTLRDPTLASVNILHSGSEKGGGFHLFAHQLPLWINIVIDLQKDTHFLMWSSFDLKSYIHDLKMFRYAVYPMPTLINRPLFMHSHRVPKCWSNFIRVQNILQACNAFELRLYKDPELRSL